MNTPSRRVLSISIAVVLIAVVVVAGYAIAFNETSTEMTVENHNDASYRITAVQNSADSIGEIAFNVTTKSGTQRYASFHEVRTNTNYHNVTVVDAERSKQVTVSEGANETLTLDGWDKGGTTAYIIEKPNGELFWVDATHCTGGHTFYLEVRSDGTPLSSSQCL